MRIVREALQTCRLGIWSCMSAVALMEDEGDVCNIRGGWPSSGRFSLILGVLKLFVGASFLVGAA